jgi:plasmid stabilization system protein ParE
MAAFILSSYADEDLESIYIYTVKNHGLDKLDVYADQIDRAFDGIAQDPMR